MDNFTFTSAQISPTIGDIDGNVRLMLSAARQARNASSQMVIFPELSLTGYHPGDLLEDESFKARIQKGLEQVALASRETPGLFWVFGAPIERPLNAVQKSSKLFYNSLLVYKDGVQVMRYDKQLLPSYNIFDERRHFEPGAEVTRVLRVNGVQVGLMICEDGWNDDGNDYLVNPFDRLRDAAPDLVISINASPSNIGKREQRHEVFSKACKRNNLPLVYVNQFGGNDQLVFDGASFVVDHTGEIVHESNRFEGDIRTLSFNVRDRVFYADEKGTPLPAVTAAGLPVMEFYRRQLVLGVRDYARRCGFTKALVGCSGGVDSALVLALAVEALGAANVNAITMPSKYSSTGSVSDSQTLCENLGIVLDEVPIERIVAQFETEFADSSLKNKPTGLARENLQSRIRASILLTYSNTHGHLLLTTGNKSETACGFFTLGGDGTGGFGLIGDLYKTEVFELCRHLNASYGREVIPNAIIEKPPSAELGPDQKDSDRLPPYEILDEILKVLIEGTRLAPAEYAHAKASVKALEVSEQGRATIADVKRMISTNEYKRRQTPPILRVRARAFGSGRQVPIAAKHY